MKISRWVIAFYVGVPASFYAVDGAIYALVSPFSFLLWLCLIQVLPPAATVLCFAFLCPRAGGPSSLWLASLSSVGLVHLFPVYFTIRGLFVGVGGELDLERALLAFLINLVFPMYTFSGVFYDGTVIGFPAAIICLIAMGRLFRDRTRFRWESEEDEVAETSESPGSTSPSGQPPTG